MTKPTTDLQCSAFMYIYIFLWSCSLAIASTGRVGLLFCGFYVLAGTPEGSTGSGSGFKKSLKTGPMLKVSSDRLGEARN